MTDAEFGEALAGYTRGQIERALRIGRLAERADRLAAEAAKLRDDARMFRLMAEVERDIAEASCRN